MSTDLHIHVFAEHELTTQNFAHFFSNELGSRWFAPVTAEHNPVREASREKVMETSDIWMGSNCSWSRDAMDGIVELIGEDHPVVDDALIDRLRTAMIVANATTFDVAEVADVVAFLEAHKGKKAFTIRH